MILVAAAFVVACIAILLSTHNRIVRRAEQVDAARAQVETQLQRRADLVPALARVTRAHGDHEETLRAAAAPPGDGVRLQSADPPALSTSETYAALQAQLRGVENRLAIARWRHAEAVRRYNESLRTVPGRVVATVLRLEPRKYD